MITRRVANMGLLSSMLVTAAPGVTAPAELPAIDLPKPRVQRGKPLFEALMLRRSVREYSERSLSTQVISELLWAAFGINRPATGDRTAPYWRHLMVIDVYAAMADGVWAYEPKQHRLLPYMCGDIRAQTGLQDFVKTAPLSLVYVAHGDA
jgi:hypothetical protein